MNLFSNPQAVGNRPYRWRPTAFTFLLAGLVLAGCQAPNIQPGISPTTTEALPAPTDTLLPTQTALPSDTPAPAPTAEPTEPPVPTVPASTASFPDPAGYAWDLVAGGLARPLDMAAANDGSGRLFVVEQAGVIRILKDQAVLSDPFLDIRDRVGFNASEQGLLGLTFHPRYAETGTFFVNYTDAGGSTVIARFRVGEDPDRADPASEVRLFVIGQPFRNHNGGGLAFGPDGYLYIALGDGGAAGDPEGNAQSLETLLGKLLRVDVDGGEPFGIPPDNPFVAQAGREEIWAWGLRNPWRIAFDPILGDLYIADVGQNVWEEVNVQPAASSGGENYGWDYREGRHDFEGPVPGGLTVIEPVAEYNHNLGCSVSGGQVYRGSELPEWQGVYFYGDFCRGNVWGLLQGAGNWQAELLFQTGASVASFGLDEAGELYLVDYGGRLLKLVAR